MTSSTPTSTYSEPHLFSDEPSVSSLIEALDNYQRDMEVDAIDRVRQENELLKQSISSCRSTWYFTLNLLREAFEAMILLEVSLSDYEKALKDGQTQWNVYFATEGSHLPR